MDTMDPSMGDVTQLSMDPNGSVLNGAEMMETDLEMMATDLETMAAGVKYMNLSDHVLRSLDINNTAGKGSLYHLLNKCCTPQGSRLLLQWVSKPLLDVTEIENRLELVEYFVERPSIRQTIAEIHLKKFPDFLPVAKKLEKGRASLQDLYRTYCAIQKIPALISALRCDTDGVSDRTVKLIDETFLAPLNKSQTDFGDYQQLIKETIDIDYFFSSRDFRIKPTLVPDLQELDEQLGELKEEMEQDWDKVCADSRMQKGKGLKLELDNRLGYLYRVTRKDEKDLRKANLTLKPIDTKTSGHRFRTSKLAELNSEYLNLSAKYRKLQENVITELVATAASYCEPLKSFNKTLAPLDVIVAFAHTAYDAAIPYKRPKILPSESGIIELKECRHPCIESFMNKDFIPNSVKFEQGKETFHIVTGPNMGGKSTYIRQVALNVIMAQIGSFVPCTSATVSLVDGVYTRIGAGDSVAKGVSTFMMEMLEVQDILKQASQYSLIIIDELGRGTSTYDGYGLAYAVSESIANDLGSYCMLTTHFNELAELKNSAKNVVLNHVTALVREKGITFQYVVQPGVCGQSFGINVAQMAGLPTHVIEEAEEVLAELENAHRLGLAADKRILVSSNTTD